MDIQKRYQNVSRSGYSAKELGKTEIARLRMIEKLIPESVHTILDAGCGEGIITNPLHRSGREIIGTDISFDSLRFLDSRSLQSSVERMPFADDTFDLVISSSVLEHLPKELLLPVANELTRITKKYIIVSTPYKEILWKSLTKCPRCGSIYHANLHLHRFDEMGLINLFSNCVVDKIEYGEPENRKAASLIWIAQHFFNRYAYSVSAIRCPVCGLVFSKQTLINTLGSNTHSFKTSVGKFINNIYKMAYWFQKRRPTHLAILLHK